MAFDSVSELIDIIIANWNNANTDSITPIIKEIYEVPSMDFQFNKTYLTVYSMTGSNKQHAIGMIGYDTFEHLGLKITTFESREHLIHCVEEMKRIAQTKRSPYTSHIDYILLSGFTDHCDKARKSFSQTIDVRIKKWKT